MFCDCHIPDSHIADERLICDGQNPTKAIFQGRFIATEDKNTSELLQDLTKWVATGPVIVILGSGAQLSVDQTCSVILPELGTSECVDHKIIETPPTTKTSSEQVTKSIEQDTHKPTPSQEDTRKPTPSQQETRKPTPSQQDTRRPTPSQQDTRKPITKTTSEQDTSIPTTDMPSEDTATRAPTTKTPSQQDTRSSEQDTGKDSISTIGTVGLTMGILVLTIAVVGVTAIIIIRKRKANNIPVKDNVLYMERKNPNIPMKTNIVYLESKIIEAKKNLTPINTST